MYMNPLPKVFMPSPYTPSQQSNLLEWVIERRKKKVPWRCKRNNLTASISQNSAPLVVARAAAAYPLDINLPCVCMLNATEGVHTSAGIFAMIENFYPLTMWRQEVH